MQLEPGTELAGKYRIEELLGEGGMGVVVLATHMELDQRVAIKVPRIEHVKDPTFAARFMREGKNAARIRNDHVARVLDVGRDAAGNPFLVMEYLEGFDLSKRIRSGPELDVPDAVDIVMQACIAVGAAHAVGVIHRDLKPANLFLESRPDGSYFVKVLDFGISKVVNDGAALENALTNTTGIIGSPMYMSPEQMVSARDVDVRTDVWSLGLILFRILTGKTPWPSANPLELATRMARESPRTPRSFRPEIPQALEAVIMQAIARNRDERTPTVYDFARALAPFDPGRGAVTLRSVPRAATVPVELRPAESSGRHEVGFPVEASTMATSAITLHTAYDEPRPMPSMPVDAPRPPASEKRSKKTMWIAGGSIFAVASVIVLFVALRSSSSPQSHESDAPKAAAAPKIEEPATVTKTKAVEPEPIPSAEPSQAKAVVEKPAAKPVEAPKPTAIEAPKPAIPDAPKAPVTAAPKPSATAAPKPTTKPTTKPGSDPWGGW